MRRERSLCLERRRRCRQRAASKTAEELVAAAVDLASTGLGDGAALELAGVGEHVGVAAAEPSGEAARVLDVAEEEGERHRRGSLAHAATQGSSARTSVPLSRRRSSTSEPAVERLDAVAQPAEARAAARVGAADAVVRDLDRAQPSMRSARTRAESAPACLTTFASASETT